MNFKDPGTYHGYVIHWNGFDIVEEKYPGVSRGDLFAAELFESDAFRKEVPGYRYRRSGWNMLSFISHHPLEGEDRRDKPAGGWRYHFVVRANSLSDNLIIGAPDLKIVNAAIRLINRNISPKVRNVAIRVDQLSRLLLKGGDQSYLMTYLLLDCPKYGSALKTMSLFGEDISQAIDLKEELNDYRARQIGLRRNSASLEGATIGSNGYVKFYSSRLRSVEECLGFVRKLDFYVD